jgi:hypothetical protein
MWIPRPLVGRPPPSPLGASLPAPNWRRLPRLDSFPRPAFICSTRLDSFPRPALFCSPRLNYRTSHPPFSFSPSHLLVRLGHPRRPLPPSPSRSPHSPDPRTNSSQCNMSPQDAAVAWAQVMAKWPKRCDGVSGSGRGLRFVNAGGLTRRGFVRPSASLSLILDLFPPSQRSPLRTPATSITPLAASLSRPRRLATASPGLTPSSQHANRSSRTHPSAISRRSPSTTTRAPSARGTREG